MTDNEIVKVLDCCSKGDCENCNRDWSYSAQWDCMRHIERRALDLIARQKEEIYQYCKEQKEILEKVTRLEKQLPLAITSAKAEAIKEFAERLKKDFKKPFYCNSKYVVVKINNLVKVMTEEHGGE